MDWKKFWQNYRVVPIHGFEDLLFQVGLTVNGKPVSKEVFDQIIKDISNNLNLCKSDNVLDLCCGNGVITYTISKYVQTVYGVDYSKPFLKNAKDFNSSLNIVYHLADINNREQMISTLGKSKLNKVYMYGSLAYFTKYQFIELLKTLTEISQADTIFFFGGILDEERIWYFFNSIKRKLVYLIRIKLFRKDPAIGTWWKKKQIKEISEANGFQCVILEQNKILHTSHYRFDILLKRVN
ncbi:class I SAM-dependent methyltransferase [Bacteroidota bacterium]